MEQVIGRMVSACGERPALHCVNGSPLGGVQHEVFTVERSVLKAPQLWEAVAGECARRDRGPGGGAPGGREGVPGDPATGAPPSFPLAPPAPGGHAPGARWPRVPPPGGPPGFARRPLTPTPPRPPPPAEHLNTVRPDALVMVQQLTGAVHAASLIPPAPLGSRVPQVLVGETGDGCCDEAGFTRRVVFDEDQQTFRDAFKRTIEESSATPDGSRFYGVVVQSQGGGGDRADSYDGCYLLKVSKSTAADCCCAHYSLVRLCSNDSIEAQQWRPFLLA